MTIKRWVASDHHFNHKNIIRFTGDDGEICRKFGSIEEHDEYIINQHNKVVSPEDKVYFLGDVTFHQNSLTYLSRMNGNKVLVRGNHDDFNIVAYLKHGFKEVYGVRVLTKPETKFNKRIILSHIPIHPDSIGLDTINIHGHLHSRKVLLEGKEDPRYVNVSMECLLDYTPRLIEEIANV